MEWRKEIKMLISLQRIKDSLQTSGKYWIVFTGDSLTSSEWVHPNWRDIVIYVLHLEMTTLLSEDWKTPEWGIKGFNFAYDGSTTKDVLEKMNDITLLKPQLVIGLMGGNDPMFNIGVEESIKNIEGISESVIASGAELVWCNSLPAAKNSSKNSEYEPYANAFMHMPEKEGLYKIDTFNLYDEFPTEKFFTFIDDGKPDLEHPNQLGNAYVAKIVLKEVFGIEFDPEKYIKETLNVVKYPEY